MSNGPALGSGACSVDELSCRADVSSFISTQAQKFCATNRLPSDLAEDVAHQCWIGIFDSATLHRGNLWGWLLGKVRTAGNQVLAQYGRARPGRPRPLIEQVGSLNFNELEDQIPQNRFEETLGFLDPNDATLLQNIYVGGWTQKELSHEYGCSRATVQRRSSAAHAQLRARLNTQGAA